ncbi:hypothetical protein OC845_004358 [Tilletia horrida]|nr:hypothetical protein OC845_004358 [Tilletia horrida]
MSAEPLRPRAVTPPSQLAGNRSPPPPPASVLRMANFDSSSLERSRKRQRQMPGRTPSGSVLTPSHQRSVLAPRDERSISRTSSSIEFVSPSQFGSILSDPSSSSSRTRTTDASSYLHEMEDDASRCSSSGEGGKVENRTRSGLLDSLRSHLSRSSSGSLGFNARLQGKAFQHPREVPSHLSSSPVPALAQHPCHSPSNPLGAAAGHSQPRPRPDMSDVDFIEYCRDRYDSAFVSRQGWSLDRWMQMEPPARREGQRHRAEVERIIETRQRATLRRLYADEEADGEYGSPQSPLPSSPLPRPIPVRHNGKENAPIEFLGLDEDDAEELDELECSASSSALSKDFVLRTSRDLPAYSFYAQNKREEASPSPPNRLRRPSDYGLAAPEKERRSSDAEEGPSAGRSADDADKDELGSDFDGEEVDDGDLRKRRRRSRAYEQEYGMDDPASPILDITTKRAQAKASAKPPQTPLKQKGPRRRRH